MRNLKILSAIIILTIGTQAFCATRVAYTRPGVMMKIPTSRSGELPYLFRVGFGSEIYNFGNFNTSKGVYFDMGLGKNFILGFSSNSDFIFSNGYMYTMMYHCL